MLTQSAPTATLIARIPIVFFMARPQSKFLKPSLAARAATDVTSASYLTTISAASF
jgi:hypothetical protein